MKMKPNLVLKSFKVCKDNPQNISKWTMNCWWSLCYYWPCWYNPNFMF